MYIDYEILKLVANSKGCKMSGTDIQNRINNEDPVFKKKVLARLLEESYLAGDVKGMCELTPKGALHLLEMDALRREKEQTREQLKLTRLLSVAALIVSFLSLMSNILFELVG